MRTLLLLAMVLAAPPADACECAAPTGPVSPADGATGVPLNAALFFDASLEPATNITLTDAGGASVALMLEPHGAYVLAHPVSALAAGMTYTVTVDRGATITTHFTTGAAEDHTPPQFAGLSAIAPEVMRFTPGAPGPGTAGCVACDVHYAPDDSVSRIHFTFPDPSPDTVLLGLELYIPGDSNALEQVAMVPSAWTDRMLGFRGCAPLAPDLTAGMTICAQLIAYDAAGNTTAGGQACAAVASCAPQFDMTTCSPADTCVTTGAGSDMVPAPAPPGGGCSTGQGAGGLVVLALLALRRRQ